MDINYDSSLKPLGPKKTARLIKDGAIEVSSGKFVENMIAIINKGDHDEVFYVNSDDLLTLIKERNASNEIKFYIYKFGRCIAEYENLVLSGGLLCLFEDKKGNFIANTKDKQANAFIENRNTMKAFNKRIEHLRSCGLKIPNDFLDIALQGKLII